MRALYAVALVLSLVSVACSGSVAEVIPLTKADPPKTPTPGSQSPPGNDGDDVTPPGDAPPGDSPPEVTPGTPDFPADGFCSTGSTSWAYCEDFDGLGVGVRAVFPQTRPPGEKLSFHNHNHGVAEGVSCETSLDCTPYLLNGSLFTLGEDSGFGMTVIRIRQPIDFANREGRIHWESPLNGGGRLNRAIHLSPMATNSGPDVRDNLVGYLNHAPAVTLTWNGDGLMPFSFHTWRNGDYLGSISSEGPLNLDPDAIHAFDFYISRTGFRLLIDGQEYFRRTVPDIGFDRAYVYLDQLAYNPAKEGRTGQVANTFQWDNVAFDGPVIPVNSLTPSGVQDILFRAKNAQTCTVRGIPVVDGPAMPAGYWFTWYGRIPASDVPVMAADIACTAVGGGSVPAEDIRFNEVVAR